MYIYIYKYIFLKLFFIVITRFMGELEESLRERLESGNADFLAFPPGCHVICYADDTLVVARGGIGRMLL